MAISFDNIPNNLRVPGQYVEIDNIRATGGLVTQAHQIVVFGQKLVAGSATANELIEVFSKEQAETYFGRGSMLALMVESIYENQTTMRVICLPFDDAGGAAKATGTITVTGTATANGTLSLLIGGESVKVPVIKDDDPTAVATAIVTAVTANTNLPVDASNALGVVTLDAKNGGTVGNDIYIKNNYNGPANGEVTPAGLTLAIVDMAGGATDVDIADGIANIPDEIYNHWICPYSDTTNLTTLKDELDRRWEPLVQLEGHSFTAIRGTTSEQIAIGGAHNNEHLTILDAGVGNPTSTYRFLASEVARVAPSLEIDPARPLQTLEIKGVIADQKANRRSFTEQNTMLNNGIATASVDGDGTVRVQRLITTYQTSDSGAPDVSYLDANTPYTLSFLRQTLLNRIKLKFPRHKLADNGTRIPVGQAMVTPNTIRAEIVSLAYEWLDLGLIENIEQFQEDLVVERNAVDRTRVDAILPPDLVNQFRVFAASIQFIL
jgi:phage tail sheath gpL-like